MNSELQFDLNLPDNMLPYILQLVLRQGLQQKLHCSKLLGRKSLPLNIHINILFDKFYILAIN